MVNVAVMGAGSWGTTLAKVFADAGHSVTVWARRSELAAAIEKDRVNVTYLKDISLPDSLHATDDAAAALATLQPAKPGQPADIVVLAVPSQTLRANMEDFGHLIAQGTSVVTVAKGVEQNTLKLMSEVVADATDIDEERIVVLTGPNLAREIATGQPAATVVACTNEARAKEVQELVATDYLRPYTNTDVVGCEIGGACKNVIALACGIASGRGLGENTEATLITRGLAEITRLGVALGAEPLTMSGLAGIGDLVATCSSTLSRNRTFGFALGEGRSLDEARDATGGQVAEGVISSGSVRHLAEEHGVEMPLTDAVYRVCHHGLSVENMISELMGRSKKAE